jgi:pyruvate formate lyase activating enzyme
MNLPRATVNKLLTWSAVDGPGNRLVLFLQGCNFACAACHNPYTIGICDHCGLCVPACPEGALAMRGGKVEFDPGPCTQCDACLEACPVSASPMVREMSVDEVLDVARANLPFLSGITVSGGEATLQLKFLTALFEAVGADAELSRLTRFVDTNGHLGTKGWQRLLPVTDGVMLAIKGLSPGLHRALTGQSGEKVIRAARQLHAAGKLYELRYLLIPGRTDGDGEIDSFAEFALSLGRDTRIRLNAFQHHGVRGKALGWQRASREGVEAVAARLHRAGLTSIVTPALYQ